jgi:16S rRNA processing protein RimM
MKKNISELSLTDIGFISKPHGFNGELIFAIRDGEAEDYNNVKFFFIELEGKPVPFFVEEIKTHRNDILVKLEDINTEADAKKLTGKKIYAEASDANLSAGGETDWTSLIGYEVFEIAYGSLGKLKGIEEYPQQVIAHCMVNGKEVLFPLNEDFISEIDTEKRELRLDLPEGLLDVYLL